MHSERAASSAGCGGPDAAERRAPVSHLTILIVLAMYLATELVMAAGVVQAPTAPTLKVLQITSGPAGTEKAGDFILTEERSIFSRTADREVIVLFRWEGAPGAHKLVAQWRSPDGGLTSNSAVDYVARDRRFGAYWRLPITPGMPLGVWTIEATVDGRPAGRHTFEMRDEKVEAAVAKRPLTHAELYERLNGIFLVLERVTSDRQQLEPAAGLLGSSGRVYTSLAAVDDTEALRAYGANGSRRDLTSVLAMNRSQGWAVLGTAQEHAQAMPVAAPDAVKVGDRCFSIEGGTAGARVLAEGSIMGHTELPGAGRRPLANFQTTLGTPGAPVMNEFGELVGIIAGPPVAGATRLQEIARFTGELRGTPVIPFTMFRVPESISGEPIAALRQRGELVAPLTGTAHVSSGGFARGVERGTGTPIDQSDRFSTAEKQFVLFVAWRPQERLRGQVRFRAYDVNNRLVLDNSAGKANYRKNELTITHWKVPVPRTAGWYRFDVLFDDKPIWRGFVRVND